MNRPGFVTSIFFHKLASPAPSMLNASISSKLKNHICTSCSMLALDFFISSEAVYLTDYLEQSHLLGIEQIRFFSMFTEEPDDARDALIVPNTNDPAYLFLIHRIQHSRDSNGVIMLSGIVYIRGDASVTAIALLNQFYSNVIGRSSSGSEFAVRIRFELAAPTTSDAIEVSRLKNVQQLRINLLVGMTQTGGNILQINPMFADARRLKIVLSNQPMSPKQINDIIKHTRSVFAHEMA